MTLRKFTLTTFLAAILLAAAVCSGVFDSFSYDGNVNRTLAGTSILLYWAIVNGAAWVVLRWKQRRRQILLAAMTTAVGLLCAEVALRQLMPKRVYRLCRHLHSSRYHHVLPPNRTLFQGYYEDPVLVKTNEDGLRTHYSREAFRKHAIRIAVMGDSFTFGLGVRQDKVWPAVMERKLRASSSGDVAVLNAGMMSYSPILYKRQFQDIIANYAPQIVVLSLDASDIGDDYRYARELQLNDDTGRSFGKSDPPPERDFGALWILTDPVRRRAFEAAAFPFTFVARRLFGTRTIHQTRDYDYYDFSIPIGGVVESNRFFIYRHPPDLTEPHFRKTLTHVTEVAEASEAIGAEFVLMPLPRYHHWNTNECPRNWERAVYTGKEPYQFAYLDFFSGPEAATRFNVFNILYAFQATKAFPLVFEHDPHWNKQGHAFVGQTTAKYLLATFPGILSIPPTPLPLGPLPVSGQIAPAKAERPDEQRGVH